jgi:hypothetical protein
MPPRFRLGHLIGEPAEQSAQMDGLTAVAPAISRYRPSGREAWSRSCRVISAATSVSSLASPRASLPDRGSSCPGLVARRDRSSWLRSAAELLLVERPVPDDDVVLIAEHDHLPTGMARLGKRMHLGSCLICGGDLSGGGSHSRPP